jgi:hypothetical protein
LRIALSSLSTDALPDYQSYSSLALLADIVILYTANDVRLRSPVAAFERG